MLERHGFEVQVETQTRAFADPALAERVPPGQYLVDGFPVLSAGPTPHTPLDEWSLTIHGAVDEPVSWSWEEFRALPAETFTVDIHCVTKWSKLGTTFRGVSVDTLLEAAEQSEEGISRQVLPCMTQKESHYEPLH